LLGAVVSRCEALKTTRVELDQQRSEIFGEALDGCPTQRG
jgi:hypothetical protein